MSLRVRTMIQRVHDTLFDDLSYADMELSASRIGKTTLTLSAVVYFTQQRAVAHVFI